MTSVPSHRDDPTNRIGAATAAALAGSTPGPLRPPGTATLRDGRLEIEHLTCTDPDVHTGARRHAQHTGSSDVTDYVTNALSVGAKALAVVGTSVDLAAVDASVQGLTRQVETAANQALGRLADAVTAATDTGHGTIPTTVQQLLADMTTRISSLVAGTDAPMAATVTEAVRAVTDQVLAEVQRAIAAQTQAVRTAVAADAPGSPFQALRADLVAGLNESHRRLAGQLTELRTALEVDKARNETATAAAAKQPAHGLDYEAAVFAALEPLAYAAGDTLTPTGNTPGVVPRALVGDAVLDLAPSPAAPGRTPRLVIECKDRDRRASAATWVGELDKAMENRQAVAALGLLRSAEQMPGSPRRLHVLSPTAYLVAYDPAVDAPDVLDAALLLLKAQAWAAVLEHHSDTDIDLAALRSGLTDALESLTGFDTLTRHATSARKQLDELDKTTLALRTNLRGRHERLLRLLDPAAAAAAPKPAQSAAA